MNFIRKARWTKDGHRTPDPKRSDFAAVISRDSIRIALAYTSLNELEVTAADVRHAYLQAPPLEKH